MAGPQIEQKTKFSAEPLDYIFDFGLTAVDVWGANAFIQGNELRRPSTENESADGADHSTGYIYQNGSAAGQTGKLEPAWATSGTITDGSITWTPIVPGGSSEDTLQSVTWTLVSPPDSALTVTNESVGTLTASATLTGGTAGLVYLIEITGVRKSGNGKTLQLYVTIL